MRSKYLSTAIVACLLLSNSPLVTATEIASNQIEKSSEVINDSSNQYVEQNSESNNDSTEDTQGTTVSTQETIKSPMQDTEESSQDEATAIQETPTDTTKEEKSHSEKVYTEESTAVKELSEKINAMSFDDVLADFGGRVSAGSLNNSHHVTVPEEKEDIDRYQLDDAFQDLQKNSVQFVMGVLNHFSEYNTLTEEKAVSTMQQDLNSLILLKVYFDRWYKISINGINLSDQMYFKQTSNKDILEIAEAIKKNPKILDSSQTGLQYRKVLKPYYGYEDAPKLVEAFVYEQTGSTDYDSWFRQYFKGAIYESQSKYKEVSVSVWDKVKNNLNGEVSKNESKNGTDNLLLPLLTVKNSEGLVLASAPGIIIYSSKKQYGDKVDEVMNQTVNNFRNFFDTIIDTHTDAQKQEILKQIKTIPVYDSDRYKYDGEGDSKKFNYYDETNILSHEFYLAIGLTKNFSGSNATGIPQGITFKAAQINNGSGGTLAHEYMHSISHIILGTEIDPSQYGFRDGNHLETIASRVNNSPSYWGGLPWVIYESPEYANHTKDPLANSADRFQKPSDLQEYFGGYTSLVNIMNQVVADVVLDMSIDDQVGYIRQWDRDTNTFKTLTDKQIEELQLKTMDDLVDNDIVIVDKSVADGEPGYNAYGELYYTRYSMYYPLSINEEPLYELNETIEMFDILMSLPQYTGWDAVQKFFSKNTGAQSDLEALRLVTQDPEMDFVKLKKLELHKNEDKVKQYGLKDHSYDDLVQLFKDNPDNFEKVKTDIYKHYIEETEEFRTDIFSDPTEELLWGDAPYTFDEQTGTLTVGSGNLGEASESPWNSGIIDGKKIEKIVFKGNNKLPKNSSGMFSTFRGGSDLSNLNTIEGMNNLDSSQVTSMSQMFAYCESLTNIDLSGFDTRQITTMDSMFESCRNLQSLDLSGFDTSQVTTMSSMFAYCESLTSLDLSNFDTSQVTTMSSMFFNCSALTNLDLGSFDTNQVKDMSLMFSNCSALMGLDVRNFNTSQVTNMAYMFSGCSSLTSLDVSDFDTNQVTDMSTMFGNCGKLSSVTLGTDFKTTGKGDLGLPDNRWIGITNFIRFGSSADFMNAYDGSQPDTYVWDRTVELGLATLNQESMTIGQQDQLSWTIGYTAHSTQGRSAKAIKGTLLTAETIDLADELIVEEQDALGNFVSIVNVPFVNEGTTNGVTTYSYSLSDLTYGHQYKLSVQGTPWNNTTVSSDPTFTYDLAYDANLEVDNGDVSVPTTLTTTDDKRIENGTLAFNEVPTSLKFTTEKLNPNLNGKLIPREEADWQIQINDYRGTKMQAVDNPAVARQDWELFATAGAFKDSNGQEIAQNALNVVYVDEQKTVHELSETNETLLKSHEVSGETPKTDHDQSVDWSEEEGLQAIIHDRNAIEADEKYQTDVTFELRSAP
ncbi:BspA family leucine-rich repeat surface protein [Enterococcus casseliflavus]|nr:BspA family leucine-rich repeat surface protein [Enterococcus casseliflavus]